MPTFLTDPAPAFYLILLAFAPGHRRAFARETRIGRASSGSESHQPILLLVYAIDKAIESPREEAVRARQ